MPGYSTPYRKDKSAHAGGILIYVSDHLLSEREPNLEIFCDECIWLKVKTNCEKYFLCTLYRQPSSSVDFWEALNRNLETAIDSTNKIIMVGDVNEDQLNERNHKLKDILILNSLKNIITSPTRITDTSSTLIDPIIVDQDQAIIKSDVLPIPNDISDHSATLIILPSELSSNTSYTRTVWNYKRADFDKLNELILNTDWSVVNIPNLDEATILFTDTFIDLAKQCIPCSEVTIRPNDKPWYNSEIRHTSKLRNRLRKKAIKSGTTDDWKNYKTLRNRVNNMKKYAREAFYNGIEISLSDSYVNNKRYFWKLVRFFVKNSNCSNNIPPLKVFESNTEYNYFTDFEKANCLNNYFVSISTINDNNANLPPLELKTDHIFNSVLYRKREIQRTF